MDLERSREAIEKLRFDSEGMELSLEMLEDAHEKKLTISEIPTVIRYDVPKGSNFTAVSHGFTVLSWALLSLSQKKPLLVLGVPGLGLLATGAAMGLNLANGVTGEIDGYVGDGLTCDMDWSPWIIIDGNRVGFTKCKRFSKTFNRERIWA